jgi:hypothetical protein
MKRKDEKKVRRDKPTPAGQERVEDRPNVSKVTPEDYPEDQRAKG